VTPLHELAQLDLLQWQQLQELVDRFETARAGGEVDLQAYLPPAAEPHRLAVLVELVKTDLEIRFRERNPLLLEDYVRRYPELGPLHGLPVSLLYEEFRVRRRYGDKPKLALYGRRFPDQFDALCAELRRNPVDAAVFDATEGEGASRAQQIPGTALEPLPQQPASPGPPPGPTKPSPPARTLTGLERGPVEQAVTRSRVRPPAPPPPLGVTPGTASGPILPIGGGFKVIRLLGKGEFGEVFLAEAPGGVQVAVKRISRALDHEASQREVKALETIRSLNHPFLLQTHQYFPLDDHLYIVMELADGSLADRCKECKAQGLMGIPVEELLTYFEQAAAALDYLHGRLVSHRDIKPQNLLMLKGYAKVADFGLAREQQATLTAASMVCGTPLYMAPEVWRSQVSLQSDQYSLAATYAEMRLGRRLFEGNTPYEIGHAHVKETPRLDPLSEEEQQVLLRALAKEPKERFPTCGAFVAALRAAVQPPPPPPPQPFPWLLAALGVGLTALLVAVLAFWPRPKPEPTRSSGPTVETSPVDWLPAGWEPLRDEAANIPELVQDVRGRKYYSRIVKTTPGGNPVIMVVVPERAAGAYQAPRTYYIMENKVWNALYREFMRDPDAQAKMRQLRKNEDLADFFRDEWELGARFQPEVPFFGRCLWPTGVEGRDRYPVFRVTPMEAHCFAQWLDNGQLPTYDQHRMAAGDGYDTRDGPFDGKPDDPSGMAVRRAQDGPWPVHQGDRDVSVCGVRQSASNGLEWTRDLTQGGTLPFKDKINVSDVVVAGASYDYRSPKTFKQMQQMKASFPAQEARPDVGFRVVLEQ
jgi:serine/threonine protein kinase